MSEQRPVSDSDARGYFRDRAVVVTGASSGIGRDVALTFGRNGAQVALLARRISELEALAERIRIGGGRPLVIQCDVTHCAQVRSAIEEAARHFGRIDVLVNSAGLLIPDTVEDLRPEDLERMMAVNLYGAMYAIQAVIPAMRAKRSGRIINIASLAGLRGLSPLGGYSASKFALVGLTEALRVELFGSGVSVSLVVPGMIDTPMSHQMLGDEKLRAIPAILAMPVGWVTWAVLAAAVFGLPEVDVPPGAALAERIASLFPAATDALLGAGTWLIRQFSERAARAETSPKGGWPMARAWRGVAALGALPGVVRNQVA
jgi:NAD(P)-dependent dehydrogenase (short-subunit alcohol dehydrogenase family)